VGTLAIGKPGAANAALFAAEILALSNADLRQKLHAWREERRDEVLSEELPL
jgi:5-(carboxyamino)imidazole ribonucleotide mutase